MENNNEENKKINFFKRIWYSIGRIDKYKKMEEDGLGKSIGYFFGVLAIICIILTFFIIQSKAITLSNLEENLEVKLSSSYLYSYCFSSYFTLIGMTYILYILLISIVLWIITKIAKLDWTFKGTISKIIYASTLSMIVFSICIVITNVAKIKIPYIDIIAIGIIYVYIFLLIRKDRKNKQKNND